MNEDWESSKMVCVQRKRPKHPSQQVGRTIHAMLVHGNLVSKGTADRTAGRVGQRRWSTSAFEPRDGKNLANPVHCPWKVTQKGRDTTGAPSPQR